MNVRTIFVLIILLCVTALVKAQSDSEVVATVGKLPITVGELKYAYSKNQQNIGTEDASISDFLNSYISYKRKIVEALSQKLDTIPSLKQEYETSCNILEQPYLNDTLATLEIAKVVYKRLAKNYKVRDLVVLFPSEVTIYPKDTLQAYNTAQRIRSKIDKNGYNYDDIVNQSISQEAKDELIVSRDYGWITSLMLDPLIENEVYNLKKNEISLKPIRTNDGYHIIKIEDERPDIGIIGLSSILFAYPNQATNFQKDSVANLANKIYEQLQCGSDFRKLHDKYSSDIAVNVTGSLGTYGVQRPMSELFKQAINEIPVNGYSKPILRDYGIHIIRVDIRMDTIEWEAINKDIISALESNKSQYEGLITLKKIENLGQEYPYKLDNNVYRQLLLLSNHVSLSSNSFEEQSKNYLSEILLSVDKRNYSVGDFMLFVKENPNVLTHCKLTSDQLHYTLNEFIYTKLLGTKKQYLQKKYPILSNISREYYEGLLYYSLMSKEVWDKASQDNEELDKLFNKNKTSYIWDTPRFEGLLLFTKDAKTKKKVLDFIRDNRGNKNLVSDLIQKFNMNGVPNVLVEKGFWSKGENAFVDSIVYNEPQRKQLEGYTETFVDGEFVNSPRNLNEVRGKVVEDHQKIIEKQLDDSLSKKYSVEINQKVLYQLDKSEN